MKKKILIVEDEKDLRLLLSQRLQEEGFEVEATIGGEETIKKLKEGLRPDLILLDLLLPGIDGYEVLSEIKKDANLELIPVIIVSNLGQEAEIKKGLNLGAVDYLIKAHFTLGEIIEKVRKILENK